MSIYGSIQPRALCEIPERDYYSGEVIEGKPTMMVDVAVSPSFNDCVRLSLVLEGDQDLLLSTDETALLIETLMKAIGTLNGTRDQHKERVEPN